MRILITGSSGFTGKYLAEELSQNGHEVFGLEANLLDESALEREVGQIEPEAVAHLAAIAYVGHGDADAFYKVNLLGTRNLLQALSLHAPDLKSVLLASSANVYGNSSEGCLTESVQPDPVNDYAVSKLSMEYMARLWFGRLPIFIVRPFNYTGVGQTESFLIPKIIGHFKERKSTIELGNLEVWREFNDVRTVAEIYRKLIEIAPVGVTLNICSGRAYSLKEVIDICEKHTGHAIEIKINPAFVRLNEVRILKGDNGKLKKYMPEYNDRDLGQTLSWMINA
jgi:nucleoside-diphosphate-sugar epimerase